MIAIIGSTWLGRGRSVVRWMGEKECLGSDGGWSRSRATGKLVASLLDLVHEPRLRRVFSLRTTVCGDGMSVCCWERGVQSWRRVSMPEMMATRWSEVVAATWPQR